MRCMLTGRIKCRPYWNNIPGYTERAFCSFCKKKKNIEILESEQHMWLECENNGQSLAWDMVKNTWNKATTRTWPNVSLGLIRGTAAISFKRDFNKDSERLRILISMTIWAIWKSRNCDNIALFPPFPPYSDNLRSLRSLRHPRSDSAPVSAPLPLPSFPSPFPVSRVSCYGLFPCDDRLYNMSPIVCVIPARCWTYSYSVDPPPPCALH